MVKTTNKKDYIWVFLLILFSGNPLIVFSAYVRELFILISLLLLLVLLTTRGKKGKQGISIFAEYATPLVLIMVYHLLAFPEAQISTNLFVLLKIFVGVAIITHIGDRFVPTYVNLMCVLSVISLFFFVYNNLLGLLPGIPIYSEDESVEIGTRTSLVFYTQFVAGSSDGIIRNTGMFWEAGAHQGFLNLALLLMAFFPKTKQNKRKIALLCATVLSTMSTTGYIVFMLVICVHLMTGIKSNEQYVTRFILISLFLMVAAYAYVTIDFLGAKVTENLSDTSSSQGRVTDFIQYGELLKSHFFLGNSYNVKVATGNGFFYQLICVGFLGTFYLMATLYRGIRKSTNMKYAFLFVLCMIVMHQGEGFLTHPLFLALPFIKFPKNNPNLSTIAIS